MWLGVQFSLTNIFWLDLLDSPKKPPRFPKNPGSQYPEFWESRCRSRREGRGWCLPSLGGSSCFCSQLYKGEEEGQPWWVLLLPQPASQNLRTLVVILSLFGAVFQPCVLGTYILWERVTVTPATGILKVPTRPTVFRYNTELFFSPTSEVKQSTVIKWKMLLHYFMTSFPCFGALISPSPGAYLTFVSRLYSQS